MDGRKITGLTLIILIGAGCRHGPAPEFPNWVAGFSSTPDGPSSDNAFSVYARAASEAESTSARYLNMVSYFPGQKASAMKDTESAESQVEAATSMTCTFEFKPVGPFQAPPYQRGWRMIGRDLVWKIEDAVQAQKYDQAVSTACIATKFGFDLTGGAATDASLGLAIADDARKAIAPALQQLSAAQLSALASGITRALASKPPMSQVIEHEHENMLEAVQTVQDAYRSNDDETLSKNLGSDASDAIDNLDEMHRKDARDRPKYFAGFAGEADTDCQWAKSVADLPVIQRGSLPQPKFPAKRPWGTFANEFFGSLEPLLSMNDQTLARSRLLILEASILAAVKTGGSAPKDLSQFPDRVKIDPYSGKPFIYGADGADYHVYSVGADFRDDGGETDETYTTPDLRLETGQ